MFPNHGLLNSLGGCGIEMDENGEIAIENEEDVKVCNEYNEAAGKYLIENKYIKDDNSSQLI